tara:strand:+ start:5886 stop:6908 length:1023 start_codon:yes stop_codon:yes gene_type:complete
MAQKYPVILLVRNDKMGDLILSIPAISWLRKNLPNAKLVWLVKKELRDLAMLCPHVDDVIYDDGFRSIMNKINSYQFDIALTFFSTFRIGYLLNKAKIPIRLAPKTKLAQFFYNHKIVQKRSRSQKPEYEYNTELVSELFNILQIQDIIDIDKPPYIKLDDIKNNQIKREFAKKYQIDNEKKIIFIHPGTGGSSNTLSIEDYSKICIGLRGFDDYNFIIHHSVDDERVANDLISKLPKNISITKISPTKDKIQMVKNISVCDLFISGSTGPLHIAGALNKKTVGFYPSKKSSTSLRWQTINDFDKRLDFEDMGKARGAITIELNKAILEIQKHIDKLEIV